MEPIFLAPYFRPKIWGGHKLERLFHYRVPEGKIGEAWVISGHRSGPDKIINGPLKGLTLREAYQRHPVYFGYPKGKEFPLLVKFLDANDNLSVQVHPDDAYAKINENDSGKTESWYVLQADPGAQLIYGHHAKSKEQLRDWITNQKWHKLLRYVPVKTGDFFYVPAGTVHALTKGIMVIETQQSSDVTYRLYDWDRIDAKTGKKRQLHLKQAMDTIQVPHHDPEKHIEQQTQQDAVIKTLVSPPQSPHFYLYQIDLDGRWDQERSGHPYWLVSVIKGSGKLICDGHIYSIALGSNFILPNQVQHFAFEGKLRLVISAPGNK